MQKKPPNKDGYYKKSFVLGFENGKQKRVVVYGKSEREAQAKLLEKRLEYEQGKLIVNKNTSFGVWAEKWVEIYKKPKLEHNSYERYKAIIRLYFGLIQGMKISEIKPINLQELLNTHAGESHSNVKKIYLTLKQIFRQALIEGLIINDPMPGVSMPQTTIGERRALSDTERKGIFAVAKNHRAGTWVMFMLCCGLRRGETIPLTWSDIDLVKKNSFYNQSCNIHWKPCAC